MRVGWVIFDYFEYGGLQRDLAAMAQACKELAAQKGVPWHSTLICMRQRAAVPPAWCDEVRELPPPWYLLTNHGRAAHFAGQVAALRGEYDCLAGFNRMGKLDFYFAGDDCLKEKYSRRNFFTRNSRRAKVFQQMEADVFAPVEAGGAKRIFTITAGQRASFLRSYPECDPQRLLLVPPELPAEFFAPPVTEEERAACRRALDIEPGSCCFIQVAAAFHTKGVDRSCRILGAAKKLGILPDFCFVVVGGDRAQQRKVAKLAAQAGIAEKQLRITGVRSDIRQLLSAADIMLHPARAESAGNVLIEAIACGLPVVCSDICGYRDYVLASGGGRVAPSPYDENTYVEILRQLFASGGEELLRSRRESIAYASRAVEPVSFRRSLLEAADFFTLISPDGNIFAK